MKPTDPLPSLILAWKSGIFLVQTIETSLHIPLKTCFFISQQWEDYPIYCIKHWVFEYRFLENEKNIELKVRYLSYQISINFVDRTEFCFSWAKPHCIRFWVFCNIFFNLCMPAEKHLHFGDRSRFNTTARRVTSIPSDFPFIYHVIYHIYHILYPL